jgi:F0F1-type ATP synthase assembly protein I
MEGDKPRGAAPAWMLAATAGSSLIGTVVAGLLLDVQFGWAPWGTLAGLVIGLVSCVSVLLKAAKRSQRE